MLPITLCLVVVLVASVLWLHLKKFYQRLFVPGPLLPKGIEGNLVDYMKDPRSFGRHMVAKYGSLYRVYTNNLTTKVAIADPIIAQQLFRHRDSVIHPWDFTLGHFFHRFIPDGMGLTNGQKWTNIRKAFKTPMSPIAGDKSLAYLEESLSQWERETLEPLASSGETIHLEKLVVRMLTTVLLRSFFGHQFVSRHSVKIDRLTNDAGLIMRTVLYDRFARTAVYKYISSEQNKTLARFQREWKELLHAYETSEERRHGEGGSFNAVLDSMNSGKKDSVSFHEVADTCGEFIFLNQDVVMPAICWILADTLVYPHLIDSLGLAGIQDMMDKATLETSFPELHNLMKESSRVHPAFPLSFDEVLVKDMELGSHLLPEGTHLSIDTYSLNHNPHYWTDPSQFQPERFQNLDDFTGKWAHFRFGFGTRHCPGKYYANLLIANTVARLLSRWRLVPVGLQHVTHHDQVPLTPGLMVMLPDVEITLEPLKDSIENVHEKKVNGEFKDSTENVHVKKVNGEVKDSTKNIYEKKVNGEVKDSTENVHVKKVNGEVKDSTKNMYEIKVNGEVKDSTENVHEKKVNGKVNENEKESEKERKRESPEPVFWPGSSNTDLQQPGVIVGVSVVPRSPLLTPAGSCQLVSFLAERPHPSAIVLVDSLNRHNMKAMVKNLNRPPSDEKALADAIKAGEPFYQSIGTAIRNFETAHPYRSGWITLLRWQDIEGEEMKVQQEMTRRYYESSSLFRARVDQLATQFLVYRRPHSKNHSGRLPYMVDYILGELPFALTGIKRNGCSYRTLIYPIVAAKVTNRNQSASIWDLTNDIHTKEEFANFRKELTAACDGREIIPGVIELPIEDINDKEKTEKTETETKKNETKKTETKKNETEKTETKKNETETKKTEKKEGMRIITRQVSSG